MLTVSTKGDYGMLFMLELAKQYKKGYVSLTDFSKRKKISSNYLHQVVIPLKENGLIQSKEGITGGYGLAMPPSKITLLSILEALEGPFAVIRCVGKGTSCPNKHRCEVYPLWTVLQKDLQRIFRRLTLQKITNLFPSSL